MILGANYFFNLIKDFLYMMSHFFCIQNSSLSLCFHNLIMMWSKCGPVILLAIH